MTGPGWETVTTPHDLAVLYRQALKYPLMAQSLFQTQSAYFPDKDGSPRKLDAQNKLLTRYPGDFAGKTGFTNLARKTLVTAAQRNGRRLIVVLMYGTGDLYGAGDRPLRLGLQPTALSGHSAKARTGKVPNPSTRVVPP